MENRANKGNLYSQPPPFAHNTNNNNLNFLATIDHLINLRDSNGIMAFCVAFNDKYKKHEETIKEYERQFEWFKKQNQGDQDRIKELVSNLNRVKQLNDKEPRKKGDAWLDHSALSRENAELTQRIKKKEKELEQCREFTTVQTKEIEDLGNKSLENEFEINQLNAQLESVQKNLKNEEDKNADLNKEVKKLRGTLDDEYAKNLTLNSKFTEEVNIKVTEMKQNLEKVHLKDVKEMNHLSTQLQAIQQTFKNAESKNLELLEENKQLQKKLNEEIGKSFAVQASFDEEKQQYKEYEQAMLKIIDDHKIEIETERSNLTSMENKNAELNKEIKKLRTRVGYEINKNVELMAKHVAKKKEYEDNKEVDTREINKLAGELIATQRSLENKEAKIVELTKEIEPFKKGLENEKTKNAEHLKEIEAIKRSWEFEKTKNIDAAKELKKFQTKLKDEMDKNAVMKANYDENMRKYETMRVDFKSFYGKHICPDLNNTTATSTSEPPPRKKSCFRG